MSAKMRCDAIAVFLFFFLVDFTVAAARHCLYWSCWCFCCYCCCYWFFFFVFGGTVRFSSCWRPNLSWWWVKEALVRIIGKWRTLKEIVEENWDFVWVTHKMYRCLEVSVCVRMCVCVPLPLILRFNGSKNLYFTCFILFLTYLLRIHTLKRAHAHNTFVKRWSEREREREIEKAFTYFVNKRNFHALSLWDCIHCNEKTYILQFAALFIAWGCLTWYRIECIENTHTHTHLVTYSLTLNNHYDIDDDRWI